MKCTLMHREIAVAEIAIDDATAHIRSINALYAPEHIPVGVRVRKGSPDRAQLDQWWTDRAIPASRMGIRQALDVLEIASPENLLTRNYGLSLSDQYWICPEKSNLAWKDVNFFENPFSDDIGDVLFGAEKKTSALDFSSPDNTSDGNLKKRWKILNGKRMLIKGGSNPFRQQPFNEVIASKIMERLGIDHVSYTLIWNDGVPYSVCEDFVTEHTELIPAWRIIQTQKRSNDVSVYQHFVNCCDALGIEGVIPFLDRMIVLDYIIANEDRHFNNFGAVREAESLKWLGMAPIYDSGTSLGYDKMTAQIRTGEQIVCKPFKNRHLQQLGLATSFDWIGFDKLSDVEELVFDVMSGEKTRGFIDENRIRAISDSVKQRIEDVRKMWLKNQAGKSAADTTDDVLADTAQSYTDEG